MKPDDQLHDLPQNLRHERDALQDAGLTTWGQVRQLDELRIKIDGNFDLNHRAMVAAKTLKFHHP